METEPLVTSLSIYLITLLPLSVSTIISFIVLIILLMISALVSGSEVAFFSLTPSDKQSIETNNSRVDRTILHLLAMPNRLLATILVVNNLVNVGIVILSTFIMNSIINFSDSNATVVFLIQIIAVTFLLLLFGEILPKVYANKFAYRFSRLMADALSVLNVVFKPLSMILVRSTNFVNRRFARKKANLSIDDLSHALEITSGDITEDKKILKGIVKFGNIEASEIMKSRMDIEAVEISISFQELLKVIYDSGYSRIPVYEKSLDDVKGILYIKDLLPNIDAEDEYNWQSLIRMPYYVPENKKINDLLTEFQANKTHLAIVIDEYGGTSGLITMEDILEEIVGEISDESDEEETGFRKIDENHYIFDAKTLLNDFYKVTNIQDDVFDPIKGDADTLAGLILELRGEIPKLDDQISYKNFIFKVTSVDKRRIKQLHVTIINKDEIIEE